jgi:NADP-dependent 3-hydroxy acid dehydrogenase YdfG
MFSEKVALVTGASSGIGEAVALTLAGAGAKVAVCARRASPLAELVARIAGQGGDAIAVPSDIAVEEEAAGAVAKTLAQFGRLDILVNSAGILQAGGAQDANLEEWRQVMDVNFFGTVQACKAALGPMLAQGIGDIVNISSTAGRRSARSFGAYSPSKFALNSYSEALRQEVGAAGVRVCVIEPGATRTECAENISDPEWRARMHEYLHKPGTMLAQDIADTVLFVVGLPRRANVSEILIRPTMDVAPQF